MGDALEDWLAHGMDGLSERTVTLYRGTIAKALNEELGAVRLTALTASDVQGALTALAAAVVDADGADRAQRPGAGDPAR